MGAWIESPLRFARKEVEILVFGFREWEAQHPLVSIQTQDEALLLSFHPSI